MRYLKEIQERINSSKEKGFHISFTSSKEG